MNAEEPAVELDLGLRGDAALDEGGMHRGLDLAGSDGLARPLDDHPVEARARPPRQLVAAGNRAQPVAVVDGAPSGCRGGSDRHVLLGADVGEDVAQADDLGLDDDVRAKRRRERRGGASGGEQERE